MITLYKIEFIRDEIIQGEETWASSNKDMEAIDRFFNKRGIEKLVPLRINHSQIVGVEKKYDNSAILHFKNGERINVFGKSKKELEYLVAPENEAVRCLEEKYEELEKRVKKLERRRFF